MSTPGTSCRSVARPRDSDDIDKYQWDIGLVLMVDRLGEQTGWMGYGAYRRAS